MKVPPSCTAVSQPVDIAWNKPFKNYLRTSWIDMLRKQLRAHTARDTALKRSLSHDYKCADDCMQVGTI
ncbi:hypothetical protein JG687_00012058 [Phytophthora cactorum]|uniref:Uncharacterized protein n=1 Tax=Phytophthora cactorum TaxID=29920 RepID=A0A8T1U4V0_9STRA|nr:hypothetical protein JG687_00012058 [Phytophthora cactorum]